MISQKTKRTLLFVLVFIVAMLPMYLMGVNHEYAALFINFVIAFAASAYIAKRYVKID